MSASSRLELISMSSYSNSYSSSNRSTASSTSDYVPANTNNDTVRRPAEEWPGQPAKSVIECLGGIVGGILFLGMLVVIIGFFDNNAKLEKLEKSKAVNGPIMEAIARNFQNTVIDELAPGFNYTGHLDRIHANQEHLGKFSAAESYAILVIYAQARLYERFGQLASIPSEGTDDTVAPPFN